MFDHTRLRFTALHEFHVERGRGQVLAIMFQLAPSASSVRRVHSGRLSGSHPLRVAGDDAVGVAVPLQIGQQLLDGDQAQLASPVGRGGGLGDDPGDGAFDCDRGVLVEPVLHPVVDVARSRLALDPAGELGLGAADSNGAL